MHDEYILLWGDGTWVFVKEWDAYTAKPSPDNYIVVPFETADWFDPADSDDDGA